MSHTKKTKSLVMPADLFSIYRKFAFLPGFSLLKSDAKKNGKWDILTAFPYQTTYINQIEEMERCLVMQDQFNKPSVGNYPFQGGIIGYLSYDYGALTHGIQLQDVNPYDKLPLVCLNWYRWCIVVNHQKHTATLIYETDTETLSKINEVEHLWQEFQTPQLKNFSAEIEQLWDRYDYGQAFEAVQSALKAGRCYQVNLSQPFKIHTSANSWQLYEQIARNNPEPYGAFLNYDTHHLLSFSPECFITVDGSNVTTKPIKGSISRHCGNSKVDSALANALKNSEKDRAENVMIVDLMRNDLSKIAQKGSVVVNRLCEIQSFPQIHHLVSEVSATKKECYSALDVLLSMFPGGSITGAPKIEVIKMISELELTTRGPYCGSVFYYSHHGRLDSNIAIRTITSLENGYWLHAGSGIVIDSQLELEYEECLIKLSAILNAIKIW